MFKRILLPTDGSKLAARGVRAGVKLAARVGAKVSGVYIIPAYDPPMHDDSITYTGSFRSQYQKRSEQLARKALAEVAIEAETAGLPCTTRFLVDARPWRGILNAARAAKCDAIVMASHGRGGLGGLILGSETANVLANSRIPVVVIR